MVIGPDNIKYVVDAAYRQFHEDVVLDESMIPAVPVLVLREDQVDAYVEATIMTQWRHTCEVISSGRDPGIVSRLTARDQILCFKIQEIGLPVIVQPLDLH